jgi:hypothetical protein
MYKGIENGIKGLSRSIMEVGKIKIGRKGEEITSKYGKKFRQPESQMFFTVTTTEKDKDDNFIKDHTIHNMPDVGDRPTELKVRLLYDDINMNCLNFLQSYGKQGGMCVGNGEKATRSLNGKETIVECPCNKADPLYKEKDMCKHSGIISVVLDCAQIVGGCWKLRTHGFNSVTYTLSSQELVKKISGGPLAGVPLKLIVRPKMCNVPGTNKFVPKPVVGFVYDGPMNELADLGLKLITGNANRMAQIENAEIIAQQEIKLLTTGETLEDVQQEFYPDQELITEQRITDKTKERIEAFKNKKKASEEPEVLPEPQERHPDMPDLGPEQMELLQWEPDKSELKEHNDDYTTDDIGKMAAWLDLNDVEREPRMSAIDMHLKILSHGG